MTIREQLERATSNHFSMSELIYLLELSPSRLDREMKHISNERWNASIAIGMGQGKRIFCFPWLNHVWKDALKVRLEHCSGVLKQLNCILLIPTHSPTIIEDIVDEMIFIH
ncbi:hypothetical protein [Paenibacillus pini]|uniref:Uncharacterized protein n=1 Tax=Paenibacillus pini JCM 16418 TaxID=1236976 RepID=W7YI70_9BACL|nr:hypothetical protein [Paenibacillus pini]GAF08142.1 hypothetical protein JCM16418_2180 [Paenibacillus pini JCM 16418]